MEEWYGGEELTERVQDLLDMSLYEEAEEMLDQYGIHHDDPWEVHFLYSRIYSEQNHPKKALDHLKECLKLDPDNPDSLLALFYVYAQMGDMALGGKYLDRAIRKQPNHELILNARLWYTVETSQFFETISIYEKNHSKLEYNPEALRNAGMAYEHLGNYDKALLCYKTSLELDPDNEETTDLLADHFLLRGNPEKCVDIYKSYLKRSPKNIKGMSRLVFCLSQCGQIEEAEEAAQKIIDIYPNSPVGYVDYSYLFLPACF
jgi:tetratricopeptide (TPR) repeat protein